MTDDTTGPGLPDPAVDDRSGPDTPGREATPAEDALVAPLLASLRSDDPGVPDHVAARIDGVLAELQRAEPPGTGSPGALSDVDRSEAGASTSAATTATVLPMQGRRRESSTARTFRWVAGAAAAIVVIGAGAAVIRGGTPDSGTSAGAAMTAEDTDGGRQAAPIRTSGTDYSSDALASQAQALVTKTADGAVGPQAPAGTPEVAPSTSPATGARSLLTTGTLAACLEQLTGRPGAQPLAVDQGSFEGKPADVVVLPSPDDATRLEVWVIGPGCTRESVELYEFRTIPSPGAADQPADPGTGSTDAPATDPGTGSTP